MKAYLQILSTGTADCPPSVLLHFDNRRYMINCGEGTQRLCMESKVRFSKLDTILFTRTHWDCLGGLPGMLLTLCTARVKNVMLLGGENLTHALISCRHFVYRNILAVDTLEFDKTVKEYQDENLHVTAVHVLPRGYVPLTTFGSRQASPEAVETIHNEMASSPPRTICKHLEKTLGLVLAEDDKVIQESQPPRNDSPTAQYSDHEIRKRALAGMFNLDRMLRLQQQQQQQPKENNTSIPCMTEADLNGIKAETAATAADAHELATEGLRNLLTGQHAELPRTRPHPAALTFICQGPAYKGKFDKKAAMDLGVKPGKLFRDLVDGKSVLSSTGLLVFPHQVVSGARPGRVFIVVDCPLVEYIQGLVSAQEFHPYQDPAGPAKVDCMVHLSGHAVVSHPEYQAWMEKFGPRTQHLMAHPDYCGQKLIWRSQSLSCFKLSMLDPEIFSIPFYENQPDFDVVGAAAASADQESELALQVKAAESMLIYSLEPTTGLDNSEVVKPMDLPQDYDSIRNSDKAYLKEYCTLVDESKVSIATEEEEKPLDFAGKDVVLTSLGTGSSNPSKYRNVSATLLSLPDKSHFLLDVGEGTFGQMYRRFGGFKRSADQANNVEDIFRNLKGIFVSHMHADHHLGIVAVLDFWNKVRDPGSEPLYLIAPQRFNTFLQELSDTQDFGYSHVSFINSQHILFQDPKDPTTLTPPPPSHPSLTSLQHFLHTSGFHSIQTANVIHCPFAFGITMTHSQGWKLVYSGDTRPCDSLIRAAGQSTTILLHEATFEEDMQDQAILKRHSTTEEAIAVGEAMAAQTTLLTHFSQRYPKIPRFDYLDRKTAIGICFDLMSVPLGQVRRLTKFLPALEVLYSPQSDEAKDGGGGEADTGEEEYQP